MNVNGHKAEVSETAGAAGPGAGRHAEPGARSGRAASRRRSSASIHDVAAAAGVSYQTVSRVINDHPNVKPSTRELVLATIKDLGFRPSRTARALAGGRPESVTVLTSNTTLYGYAAALQGIEEAARAAGFAVGVRVVEAGAHAVVRDAVARAVEPGAALIVIAFDEAGTEALAAVPRDVPLAAVVDASWSCEGRDKPWAWIDDREAASDATRYLLELGHKTVHCVAIPSPARPSQRTVGWRSALTAAGLPVPEPLQADWYPGSGYGIGQVLARDPDVTAVLCGNDDLALGVIRAMHEAGRKVPDDVSIVGFDDTPHSLYYTPPLTTVRMDFTKLGRVCFALLRQQVHPASAALPSWPRAELIIRESTGPLARWSQAAARRAG